MVVESRIATSIEQSKKLIELGIDVNTADMRWEAESVNFNREVPIQYEERPKVGFLKSYLPAWSLSALLGLIPKPLLGQHLESGYWECTTWEDFNVVKEVHGQDNPLDAAFEMIVWLLENDKL